MALPLPDHVDVLIVGAGLSGVGAAWHLQARCPDLSYAIVEARASIGGTWDLFRYPGIRSDSDMYTLGYAFRPWTGGKALADGPSIKAYVEETAAACGIDRHIHLTHRVVRAAWSSSEARWTVDLEIGDARTPARLTCGFLFACAGYYRYDAGHTPTWPGMETFAGRIVHPQRWPEDLDYAGKRVVVIGSGATAVTLVPALAERAAHVTMLQRTPTYVASLPSRDGFDDAVRRALPARSAHAVIRWKNIARQAFYYQLARRRPELVRRRLRDLTRAAVGPDVDVDRHFAPPYAPWDQRLCIVPDDDLFRALRERRASIVTDHIARFTPTGIALRSGEHLDADVIVTATGLTLQALGGIALTVDGRAVDLSRCTTYRGVMYTDVPNLASAFGYTNASWTLKCDLIAEHVARLLAYMRRRGLTTCVPRLRDPTVRQEPLVGLTAGYIQRAQDQLPKQGSRAPWRLHQSYLRDLWELRYAPVVGPELELGPPTRSSAPRR